MLHLDVLRSHIKHLEKLRSDKDNVKVLVKASAILDHIIDYLVWLAAILLIFGWLSVCFEVLMRYFLNRPTVWTLEITENILVWVTFLGTAWLLRREGHVKIDFLILRLKPIRQAIINSITSISCAIICLAVAFYGVQVVWNQFQRSLVFSTILELPMAPFYIVVPIAFFLLCIQFLRRTYGYLAGWRLLQAKKEGSVAMP